MTVPNNQQQAESTIHDAPSNESEQPEKKRFWKNISIADRCALFIALALLVVNICTLVHLRDESRLAQRAWVGLHKGLHEPVEQNRALECYLSFTNVGQTPAMNVTGRYTVLPEKKGFDIESYVRKHAGASSTDIPSRGPIIPGQVFVILANSREKVSQEEASQINSRNRIVYIFGEITYKDIFGERHESKYCYIVDPNNEKLAVYGQYNKMN